MIDSASNDDILELPIYNPHKESIIEYLTNFLIDATEDRILDIFLVARGVNGNTRVCWSSSEEPAIFNAAILRSALNKLGLIDRSDINTDGFVEL